MSRMYPHTVTVWHRLGEVDRKEAWHRAVISGANLSVGTGSKRTAGGDMVANTSSLIIRPVGYVMPGDFTAESDDGWTLGDRDMVAVGNVTDATPPKGALSVVSTEAICVGGKINHVEAVLE